MTSFMRLTTKARLTLFIFDSRQKREDRHKTEKTVKTAFQSNCITKKITMKDLEVKDPVPPTRRIHKLVLTGGPCGGKTTGQGTSPPSSRASAGRCSGSPRLPPSSCQ